MQTCGNARPQATTGRGRHNGRRLLYTSLNRQENGPFQRVP